MDPLADDLAAHGYAAWNIEYRRVGQSGGGWPGTLHDVAAAIDHLTDVAATHPLDLDRVAFVGHSAGGHLALWSAGRAAIPAGLTRRRSHGRARVAIGQGPVVGLTTRRRQNVGNDAVLDFLGGTPTRCPIATTRRHHV